MERPLWLGAAGGGGRGESKLITFHHHVTFPRLAGDPGSAGVTGCPRLDGVGLAGGCL